jgi:hypothetical protein
VITSSVSRRTEPAKKQSINGFKPSTWGRRELAPEEFFYGNSNWIAPIRRQIFEGVQHDQAPNESGKVLDL